MLTRNERLLHSIDLGKGAGLEIGPLSAPVVKKTDGRIYYLDHLSTKDLRSKYKDDPVDQSKIVPIDYILDRTLPQTVKNRKFDYVIASHVIEHIPNVIAWLREVSDILREGGILSLAIPDRRFTFDIKRNETTPSEIIARDIEGITKPSAVIFLDFYSNYVDGVETSKAWQDPEFYLNARTRWTQAEALEMSKSNIMKDGYVDCHCSVFTPESFVKILETLIHDKLLPYTVSYFLPTQPGELEFYVSLKKTSRNVKLIDQFKSLPTFPPSQTELQELTEQTARLKEELYMIKNSVSWKVTAPIRAVRSSLSSR